MTRDKDLQERMLVLAKNLLEATDQGKISWALTDEEQKFLYAGSRSSVTIESYRDRDGDNVTTLSLLNSRGTTVDSLQTDYAYIEDHSNAMPWNDILEDLYHAARRVAHNVDEAIESMLVDIERGTPSPQPKPKKAAEDPWAADARSFGEGASDEPPF